MPRYLGIERRGCHGRHAGDENSSGGGGVRVAFSPVQENAPFDATRWSLIATLRSGEAPQARVALETLCRSYWYPLYAYVRRCGQKPEDAADLTQAFFSRLVEKEVFTLADPARGRLRTFLLTSMQRFMRDEWRKQQREKRGGGVPLLSIDERKAEGYYAREPVDGPTPESLYHRRWALTLLERTVTALQADYVRQGKSALFEALKPTLTEEPDTASSLEIGVALGLTPGAVRVAVFRLRTRYREKLLAEVATSLDARSEADVDEEIDALFRALG